MVSRPVSLQGVFMKSRALKLTVSVLAAMSMLSACGGGEDDEAGGPTPLSITPETLTITGPTAPTGFPATCPLQDTTNAVVVFIYGGAAPYRLDNSSPQDIVLDKSSVAHPGQSFTVTAKQGCYENSTVTVLDSLNNRVTFTLSSVEGDVAS